MKLVLLVALANVFLGVRPFQAPEPRDLGFGDLDLEEENQGKAKRLVDDSNGNPTK